jgi:DNA polymerase-3 subunit chi
VTHIAFHFGAADKTFYTCRLLRKASGTGARVLVLAESSACSHLEEALWGVSATDFVPHCQHSAPDTVLQRSSVVLSSAEVPAQGAFDVMVNLGALVPDGFDAFGRVIEVVSLDETDRQLARQRWKKYTELGYTIERHDLKNQITSPE